MKSFLGQIKNKKSILIMLTVIYMSSLFIYAIILVPRPYYIQSTDIENNYYYDARLIYNGLPTRTVTHPATPLFYIYSKVFNFTGDNISSTQKFLRIIYFSQTILNILALIIFIRFLPEEQNPLVKFFMLAIIAASPSFLTYQDYIGADATMIIFSVPILLAVWALINKETKSARLLILIGIYLGFLFAVKFSFVLLIVPVYISLLISSYLWQDWRALKTLLILPIISVFSFLIFISRVVYRLPAIINQTILHDMTDGNGVAWVFGRLLANVEYLMLNRPIFSLTILFVLFSFLSLLTSYFYNLLRGKIYFSDEDRSIIPQSILGIFGIIILIYTLAVLGDVPGNSARGEELGVTLRNMALALILFPFMVLAAIQLAKRIGLNLSKNIYLALFALSLLLVSESVIKHVSYRNHLIKFSSERIKKTEEKLLEFIPKGAKFAIWGSGSYAFGPAMFHYWGNHRYGWNSFDEELRKIFDPVGFFQYRVAGQLVGQNRLDTINRNYALPPILQRYPILAKIYLSWRRKFPPPKETDNILTGEGFGENPKIVMFPEVERELPHKDDEKLIELLEYRLGYKFTKRIENIEGRDWTIFISED